MRPNGANEALFFACLFLAIVGVVAWAGIIATHDPAADVNGSVTWGIIYLVGTLILGALAEGTG